jgi:RND family efflux transporter MFP subunit
MTRILSLLSVLALLGGAVACGAAAPEDIATETVVPVVTEPAATGTIRGIVHATGVVAPAPGADLVVIAPEAARIAEMPVAEGDRVSRGDLLVRFDIPSVAADVAARASDLARAQAQLVNARAARTRAHDLFDRGVAARKETEDADRALADAEAAVAEAQAGQQASQAIAQRATVVATFDGLVARRTHNPGDLVEPSAADPVLRVIDPRRLEVTAAVPIDDIPRVVVGASARIPAQGDREAVTLRVLSRPAVVDSATGAGSVRLAFASGSVRYAVGTPVTVEIDADRHAGVIVVPMAALVRDGAETAVFVAADGKAKRVPVELGLSDGTRVEITSGLKAGDPVIVSGQLGLPDDAAISVGAAAH